MAVFFSNGASIAFRVGAELSDRIAAISPNAGACWTAKPRNVKSLSVCYLTGAADPLNPVEGGYPRLAFGRGGEGGGKPKPPVHASIEKWAVALECPVLPVKDETENGVRTRRYGPGRDGAEIVWITIKGLGHIWAGGENLVPEILVGKPTDKLKATDVIWDFFRAHPAP